LSYSYFSRFKIFILRIPQRRPTETREQMVTDKFSNNPAAGDNKKFWENFKTRKIRIRQRKNRWIQGKIKYKKRSAEHRDINKPIQRSPEKYQPEEISNPKGLFRRFPV